MTIWNFEKAFLTVNRINRKEVFEKIFSPPLIKFNIGKRIGNRVARGARKKRNRKKATKKETKEKEKEKNRNIFSLSPFRILFEWLFFRKIERANISAAEFIRFEIIRVEVDCHAILLQIIMTNRFFSPFSPNKQFFFFA